MKQGLAVMLIIASLGFSNTAAAKSGESSVYLFFGEAFLPSLLRLSVKSFEMGLGLGSLQVGKRFWQDKFYVGTGAVVSSSGPGFYGTYGWEGRIVGPVGFVGEITGYGTLGGDVTGIAWFGLGVVF